MRRIISIILMLSLLLSSTSCSSDADSNNSGDMEVEVNESKRLEVAELLKGDISGTIDVSCYDSVMYKNYLEEAARAFEAKYPNAKVNVSTFSEAPEVKTGQNTKVITTTIDEKGQNDYISRINTELMTGGGADILAMDILPYYKYAENGQLEDLNLYMDEDETFNKDDYRQNILDAVSYKGGQYIFPLEYSFNLLSYDKTLLDSNEQNNLNPYEGYTYNQLVEMGLNSFDKLNIENSDSPVKMFSLSGGSLGSNSIFSQLLNLYYDNFVDVANRKANFNSGEFADLLKRAKEYEDKGYLNTSMQKGDKGPEMLKQNASNNYIFKTIKDTMLLQAFDDNTKGIINIGGGGMFAKDDELAGILINEENEVVFDFMQAYGINSNSDNKKAAWEFVKFLTSEEMQNSLYILGRPINNKANEEKAKQQITGELFSPENNTGSSELNEKQTEIYDSYMSAINKYSDMLNKYMLKDTVINQMINSEAKYFFDGSRTAEEVADILQNKVELYLNE